MDILFFCTSVLSDLSSVGFCLGFFLSLVPLVFVHSSDKSMNYFWFSVRPQRTGEMRIFLIPFFVLWNTLFLVLRTLVLRRDSVELHILCMVILES